MVLIEIVHSQLCAIRRSSLTYPLPVALFGRGYIDLLGLNRFPLGNDDFKHAMV